jgi:hypothetical protein
MNVKALRNVSMSTYMKPEKTSEINLIHPVAKNIVEQIETNAEDKSTKEMIFSSIFSLKNSSTLSSQIKRMIPVELVVKLN